MKHDHRTRSATLFLYFFIAYACIACNLIFLQIKQHKFFHDLGQQQYTVDSSFAPDRASIFDRSGTRPLAINRVCLSAFIEPNNLKNPTDVIAFLETEFPEAHKRLIGHPHRSFIYVKRRLTPEQENTIRKAELDDIHFLNESSRFYPVVSAAPLVGMTNIDNHGSFGLELTFEQKLAGTPVLCKLERDARSGYFHFKKTTTDNGTPGEDLITSIDADLQFLVNQELQKTAARFASQAASAVIMNPENGEVLAMSNVPHFNPNKPQSLNIEETVNMPIAQAFELGSVMKVFTALAALEEGVATTDEIIDCHGTTSSTVDGRVVNTWRAHNRLSIIDVIALSNNIGIATIASRVGSSLYDHYLKLGFGTKTAIELPGEQSGHLNPPHLWSKQSIMSLSYGYEISATILQLACAFSTIANGGYQVKPTILLTQNNEPHEKKRLYQEAHITATKNMLAAAVERGTARATAIPGYRIMCKTGTANLFDGGSYHTDRNIYACAGIVEKENYKRVIVVSVREGNGTNMFAATVAAPLFKRVARAMLVNEHIVT